MVSEVVPTTLPEFGERTRPYFKLSTQDFDHADDIVNSLRETYEREVYSEGSGTVFRIDVPPTGDLVEFVLNYQPQTA